MRALAALVKTKREALAEEEAFLIALRDIIKEELTCPLTLVERLALEAELDHVAEHRASTMELIQQSLSENLETPWHIYELPVSGSCVEALLLGKIRQLDAQSRRLR